MPLISVIIPVYNGEKTIRETIESVLNQTFHDFELLIIDDSSQDATLEIIASIVDPRIQVFSYPKANASITRNRGIEHASGEYIAFLDADDLWTPDKLEKQLAALTANPQMAIAYSWTNYIDQSGNFLHPGSHETTTGNVYARLLLTNFINNGSNALIKRSALDDVGAFDPQLLTVEDWDLWLRLAARYEFVAIPFYQVLYRVSPSSLSNQIAQMEADYLTVIHKNFAQAPSSLQPLKRYSLGNLYKYLTFKALQHLPKRKNGLLAANFLSQAIKYDPAILKTKVVWKILFIIGLVTILPNQTAQSFLQKAKQLINFNALLVHIRINVSDLVKSAI